MITKEKNGLKWLEFELFQPFKELKHGILTKQGGYSSDSLKSLNLNIIGHQDSQDVQKNLKKIKESLDLPNLIYGKQVHGDQIQEINQSNQSDFYECDGFITKLNRTTLLIKHADCQAALFYDPIQKVIANVHCGWKGNRLNIYKKTVDRMKDKYQCKPENIQVGISPSLDPENSEFKNYKEEFPRSFWNYQIKANYFNFWSIAEDQLRESGILAKHLKIAGISTHANSKDFFSYRRNQTTERNGSFISLF